MAFVVTSQAAVPSGVQLHATQTFVRSNGSEPESMDPAVAETVPANQILRDLFEGLTATDTSGKTVPGVALSWKQTNPTTWVFKLRANAKFSNGEPVTAEDFVYGIRRFVDPKTASPYATTFGVFLLNGLEVAQGKKPTSEIGVKALDKLTLEIKTQDPVAFMPELVSNTQLGPVLKATVEKWGKDWVKPGNMVGNGAFVLKDWQVNNRIVVEKNPQYWDATNVHLTRVTYLPIEDQSADVKLWESGETDYVYQLPPGVFDKYKAQYPKELRNQAIIGLRYYDYQTKDPVFKDVRVRKALNLAVDRETIKRVTMRGLSIPAAIIVAPGVHGYTKELDKVAPADVDGAKKLLAEAGYPNGFEFGLDCPNNRYVNDEGICQALVGMWARAGLKVKLNAQPMASFIAKVENFDHSAYMLGWGVSTFDALFSLQSLVHTKGGVDGSFNLGRVSDPKLDALIDAAKTEMDPKKRDVLLHDALVLTRDNYYYVPLHHQIRPWAMKKNVTIVYKPDDRPEARYARVE